jgi:hypothetical protein
MQINKVQSQIYFIIYDFYNLIKNQFICFYFLCLSVVLYFLLKMFITKPFSMVSTLMAKGVPDFSTKMGLGNDRFTTFFLKKSVP